MKFQIVIDENLEEEELVLKCREFSEDMQNLQAAVCEIMAQKTKLVLYKDNTEYYLSPQEILFFETDRGEILAHTKDDIYFSKCKLYELETILPKDFQRISKSGIVNITKIFSITKNITGASAVEFRGTHKQIYVSRSYYKLLKDRLEEKRNRSER